MPHTESLDRSHIVSQGDHSFPKRLDLRLGENSPKSITVVGPLTPLSSTMTAFLCSKETPGATILKAFDQAAAWRDAGRCVVSGFHSPLERQCLDILLRGKQPVVMALARGIGKTRLPPDQRRALNEGRLTIISQFSASELRATAELAQRRNHFIAALAEEVVFAYIAKGGALDRLQERVRDWKLPTDTLVDSD